MHLRSTVAILSLSFTLGFAVPALPQELKFPHAAEISEVGKRDLSKGVNFYSLEKEKELGKQLAIEVERSSRMLRDPDLNTYVNALAQKLAGNSDARMPIVVQVIDSRVADAITLPGGFLFITSGAILQTTSEAELAGLIARGIALTAMRSGTAEATKGDIMQLASIQSMIFIPYSWAGWGVYQGQNLAIQMNQLRVRARYVLAADYFAAQYLYVSGYDPGEFAAFLERTDQATAKAMKLYEKNGWFPSLRERAAKLKSEIADILPPRAGAVHTTSEFDAIKEKVRAWEPDNSRPVLRTKPNAEPAKSFENQN